MATYKVLKQKAQAALHGGLALTEFADLTKIAFPTTDLYCVWSPVEEGAFEALTQLSESCYTNPALYSSGKAGVGGPFGHARFFDGTNDFEKIHSACSPYLEWDASGFFIEVIFLLSDTPSGTECLFGKRASAGGKGWLLSAESGGNIKILGDDGVDSVSITSSGTYDDQKWHTVQVYSDGSTLSLVMDGGTPQTAGLGGVAQSGITNSLQACIGGLDTGAAVANPFDGAITFVSMGDGEPTAARLAFMTDYLASALAGDFPSIQTAIYQASAGDTIEVEHGDYSEALLLSKQLLLKPLAGVGFIRLYPENANRTGGVYVDDVNVEIHRLIAEGDGVAGVGFYRGDGDVTLRDVEVHNFLTNWAG